MNAGIQVTPAGFQALIGAVALNLKQNFDRAVSVKTWLDANPPAGSPVVDPLTVAPFSYSADQAAMIRAAFADLAYMKTTAFDTSTNVKQLYGCGEMMS